jgi:hypothetical protein
MLWGLMAAYFLIGVIVGRLLFVKRLDGEARYYLGKKFKSEYSAIEIDALIETDTFRSAQTYGLWSPFVWPFTLSFFLIQAPTPEEVKIAKREKDKREIAEIQTTLKELEQQYGKMADL